MNSNSNQYFQIYNKKPVLKTLALSFALYIVFAPFSGYFPLQGNLIIYFNQNLANIQGLPKNINPIFLSIEILMYQIEKLLEYIFPMLWGSNNYFFIRFILKLPLFIFYFLNVLIIQKIIDSELNNPLITTSAFYIQLLNIPLIYSTFILGTSESLAIFFFLLSYLFIIQALNEGEGNDTFLKIFFSGFLLGLAGTFSFWFLTTIFLFLPQLKIRKITIYFSGIILSMVLVFIPYYFIFKTISINYTPDSFGISNILHLIGLSFLIPFFLILVIVLVIIFSLYLNLDYIDRFLIIALIIIIFSPYLSINEFIIFLELFILGMIKYSGGSKVIKVEHDKSITLPSFTILFILALLYLVFSAYIVLIYPIFEVFYLKLIELSFFGRINLNFWQNNSITEFKILFYIIISVLLAFGVFIVQKKRKIYNINKKKLN